ncbi:sterol desaturase family protein [Polaribacter sp.]|uniref:sterol desaturase family protein n=1 Tax=Polaribacter sp. TaxID=1920175 RepID=UPI003F69C1F7
MLYAFTTIGVFLTMEGITWLTHKYVMHGFGWFLHADHHEPGYPHVFEKNDAFFVVFAVPSIALFFLGSYTPQTYLFFIGLGILCYGLAYFLVHDVLIHRRFSWFKNTNNRYLKALRKAHKVHHKNMGKEDSQCFGMLFVPLKYFREQKLI